MELRWGYLLAYMVAVPAYMMLTVLAPSEAAVARYHISTTQLFLLQATIIVPVMLIWLSGLRGVGALRDYVSGLPARKEFEPFHQIVLGLSIIVFGLIVSGLFGALRPYLFNSGLFEGYQVISTYLNILFPLAGIVVIWRGSLDLLRRYRLGSVPNWQKTALTLFVTGLVTAVVILLFNDPYRTDNPDHSVYTSYFLSDPLIILSVILPSFASWLVGGWAALNLRRAGKRMKETAFREAFAKLANAIVLVLSVTVAIQFLSVMNVALTKLSLGVFLLVIYLLLLVYAGGFLLISAAARKLLAVPVRGRGDAALRRKSQPAA